MEIMVITFIVLLVVIVGMSVGVIFSNKPIKGSCGGMSALGMDTVCDICGGRPEDCDGEQDAVQKKEINKDDLAYEVK
ncbi:MULTISPECIES: (Na+)-NQR maturation NqrM [unclassified Marinobacterium]|jgi:uncharacterized protein|uniref:(Na+)-NQR maturation NqrM n=1 Tax=unclassified Marinobacterium TaxID=2644139 RepID=UPI00156903FA|nr:MULTISPECIES: (Na+)-NQR maturation NqrM [unclassified Marinobacterium]NRP11023.1 hypothetical protein [Marinobacterium sp. xm-g-48]NRP27106.1 hypothetical protein [Marinobacterium sp. xm-d-420]NRP36553.1 hypothetical protein [Marinobacterium sp. xm-d-579]NRP39062.1 hypothetical protein [Marinobacterium sp. xm-a-121]NRP48006.1 hypothetical protein [Marinobacterium sp. xm-d-543]